MEHTSYTTDCFQQILLIQIYLNPEDYVTPHRLNWGNQDFTDTPQATQTENRQNRNQNFLPQIETSNSQESKENWCCSSTDLPMSRNSPTNPWRLMAMRMLRTVMPSQKHATTLALGRWALSLSSSRSKLCSPALLQILPWENRCKQSLWQFCLTISSASGVCSTDFRFLCHSFCCLLK